MEDTTMREKRQLLYRSHVLKKKGRRSRERKKGERGK
jgi:hypothetical protein